MRTFYRGNNPVLPAVGYKHVRWLLVVTPIVLSAYLLAVGHSGLSQIWMREQQIAEMNQKIAALEAENVRLEKEAKLLTADLQEIERIAREHYGMVKENESVYMVYPSAPTEPESKTP